MFRFLINLWLRPLMMCFADVPDYSSSVDTSDFSITPDLSSFDLGSLNDPFTPSFTDMTTFAGPGSGGAGAFAVSDPTGSTFIPNSPPVQPAPTSPGWQSFATSVLSTGLKAYNDTLPSVAHPVTPIGKLPSSAIPAISKAGLSTTAVVAVAAIAIIGGLIALSHMNKS